MNAARSADRYALAPGIIALPHGLLWMERCGVLAVADAHFGYEDAIGGALPLWSTRDAVETLIRAASHVRAREIVFLGDVIHSSRLSEGAARTVRDALARLRAERTVTIVAGNHEGRSRGAAILGETFESVERDGWVLAHGDVPVAAHRVVVGHLHPSLPLGGRASVPAFVASQRLVVVPALTPYSPGLNVLSRDAARALRALDPASSRYTVVASIEGRVYPFGFLDELRDLLR